MIINELWRFAPNPSWQKWALPQNDYNAHLTLEWPDLMTIRGNPASAIAKECAGNTDCIGNWYETTPPKVANISIGPLDPTLEPPSPSVIPDFPAVNAGPPDTPATRQAAITGAISGCRHCGGSK